MLAREGLVVFPFPISVNLVAVAIAAPPPSADLYPVVGRFLEHGLLLRHMRPNCLDCGCIRSRHHEDSSFRDYHRAIAVGYGR